MIPDIIKLKQAVASYKIEAQKYIADSGQPISICVMLNSEIKDLETSIDGLEKIHKRFKKINGNGNKSAESKEKKI